MTPAQISKIMALVSEYAELMSVNRKDYAALNAKWQAVEAELRDAPQQAIPAGTRVVDRGFRFDGERQEHVPQLVIEFEPAPVNSGYGAKGWKDRDHVAAMLTTCDCLAKDMPFGRCCKANPSAPTSKPLFGEMIAQHPGLREEIAAESERAEFEAHFKHLDFTMDKDAWERPIYRHPHVFSLWTGWQARASKGTP